MQCFNPRKHYNYDVSLQCRVSFLKTLQLPLDLFSFRISDIRFHAHRE